MNAEALTSRWRGQHVVVLGDAMLDGWLTGTPKHISREAPVAVVQLDRTEHVCGGAANTAANLAALDARPRLIAVVGDDEDGARLRACLKLADVESGLVTEAGRTTVAKSRLVADEHMLVRFDTGDTGPVLPVTAGAVIERLKFALHEHPAALIVCDYACGALGPQVRGWLARHRSSLPLLVVDAHDLRPWAALAPDLVTPSYAEARRVLGHVLPALANGARPAAVASCRQELLSGTAAAIVAVTLDVDGSMVLTRDGWTFRTSAVPVSHSLATGAGDAYAAGFALALTADADVAEAAAVAQCCATVVTKQPGTTVCSAAALHHSGLALKSRSRGCG